MQTVQLGRRNRRWENSLSKFAKYQARSFHSILSCRETSVSGKTGNTFLTYQHLIIYYYLISESGGFGGNDPIGGVA